MAESKKKAFTCNHCDYMTNHRSEFVNHVRVHTGETPYSCSECGKAFKTASNCRRHETTHLGGKPFECDICFIRYSAKETLVKHMRIHTGENLFCCNYCDKKFAQSCHFKAHMRSHTGEKPHKCPICKKCFSQKSALQAHQTTHQALKLPCTICGKVYRNPDSRRKHMKRTHEKKSSEIIVRNESYTCPFCKKQYQYKKNILSHVRRKHDAEEEDGKAQSNSGTEMLFNCSWCDLTFLSKRSRMWHVMTFHKLIMKSKTIVDHGVEGMTKEDETLPEQRVDACNLPIKNSYVNNTSSFMANGNSSETDSNGDKSDSEESNIFLPDCSLVNREEAKANEALEFDDRESEIFFPDCNIVIKEEAMTNDALESDDIQSEIIFPDYNAAIKQEAMANDPLESDDKASEILFPDYKAVVKEETGANIALEGGYPKLEHDLSEGEENSIMDKLITKEKIRKCLERYKKSFECSICGKKFSSIHFIQRHMHIHTNSRERRFPCTICDKAFMTKGVLRAHMLIHGKKKTFKCPKCDKKFNGKKGVRYHFRSAHEGEIVHCTVCDKLFKNKFGLDKHMKRHDNKPFFCPHCKKMFSSLDDMHNHQQNYKACLGKKYKCSLCNSMFTCKSNVIIHMKCKHAVDQEEGETTPCDTKSSVQCTSCEKYFTNERSYFWHEACVHKLVKKANLPDNEQLDFADLSNINSIHEVEIKSEDTDYNNECTLTH